MEKRVTLQGVIKLPSTHDKKSTHHLKNIPKKEAKNFEIDRNEFPSLNEISDKVGHHGKNSTECNKSFSYSEKLKKAPTESRSSMKLEATSIALKSRLFVKEYSSLDNVTSFKSSMPKSEEANADSEISQSNGVSNQECSRKLKVSDKCQSMNYSVRYIPLTTNPRSARALNDGRSLKVKNEISSVNNQKTNSQWNRNTKLAMENETTVQSISNIEDNKIVNDLQNAGPSNSKKQSNDRAPSFKNNISRNERSGSKHPINNREVLEQTDSHSIGVKKKKRKSKVKRQAALQSGKILVLTPEAHSKLFNQSNINNFKQNKDVANINDSEEYPELGTSAVPKSNKENNVKHIEITTKDTLVSTENELHKTKLEFDLVDPQPISVIKKTEAKEERDSITKSSGIEKASVPVKDAITVSLFDMILTSQARKREAEKKNELIIQDSPLITAKPLPKVLGKKGISFAVNPLDSSRPAIKRGKEREKPKIKKPSRMRKLILLGRQSRKEEMDMAAVGESEKDAVYIKKSDNELPTSKLIESTENAFNPYLTSHDENILLNDNDYCDNKVSSPEENAQTLSNEENQNVLLGQNKSSNSECFLNDSGVLITGSPATKASEIFSTIDFLNHRELEENYKSLEKDQLFETSCESYSSHELILNSFKNAEDCTYDGDICVLDDTSMPVKTEDFDLEVRNNSSDKKKGTVNSEPSLEHSDCDLSIHESYAVIKNSRSSVLEESSCDNTQNKVEKENEYILGCPLKNKASTSFAVVDGNDASSLTTNFLNSSKESMSSSHNKNVLSDSSIINSESSQKKEGNSFESDLNECTSSFGDLLEHMHNITSQSKISNEEKSEAVKSIIHSRKFRKYCNHFISKDIDSVVFKLLDDLARFQDRLHQKDPVKARVRKRLLYGIKEIKRHMKLKKLKGIILSTNIEDIKTEGGLNDVVAEIISLAEAYHIPYIFSHQRFNLGKVCRKGVAVSCVGIFNYEGSEQNFKRILELQEESKRDYSKVMKALDAVLSNNQIADILNLVKGEPEKLHEVRTNLLREHFKPDTNSNGQLDIPEVSTKNAVDDIDSNESICQNQSLLTEPNISVPEEIDKDEIYRILMKYNIV